MIWVFYFIVVVTLLGTILLVSRKKSVKTQVTSFDLPLHIDRSDFDNKNAEILVLVFSSETCDGCDVVWNKTTVLQSSAVDVEKVSYQDVKGKKLHLKYQIEAVPSVLVCDEQGSVFKAFLGNVTATDLWAAVAELRGSQVEVCDSH